MLPSRFQVLEFGSVLHKNSVKLREEVLRAPLGLSFSPEDIESEKEEFHLAMVSDEGDNPIIYAILLLKRTEDPYVIKMRQVATKPELQNKGIGSELVSYAENFARDLGFLKMELNARQNAVPFYLRLGYKVVSEQFFEVTIPHFKMVKSLS